MEIDPLILQQLINGLSNGLIIALIALGYTMVYGIVELINFAHGDLFMLGCFLGLTLLSAFLGLGVSLEPGSLIAVAVLIAMLILVPIFCAGVNVLIERVAYRPLRNAPKLAPLVSAIGVSFILLNIGLFWGGLPLDVFAGGKSAAAPKDFPSLLSFNSLLPDTYAILITPRDLLVFLTSLPAILGLTFIIKKTKTGRAMRAVAQNPMAAQLMGINPDKIISATFAIGGLLAGVASVVYSQLYNTISFTMGFRVGIDAFTAAVLGGIGNLPGALCGGIIIGLVRAFSDQYIATQWTSAVVFSVLIMLLIFRPGGLLGSSVREQV